MNEFSKPYEYCEEKGVSGVLLLLFIMLIVFEPFMGIIVAFFSYSTLKGSGVLGTIFLIISIIYILFSIVSAILLKRVSGFAMKATKLFLAFRLIFLIPFTFVNTVIQIREIPYRASSSYFRDSYNSIITSCVVSLVYIIAFSVLWYIYLNKSKKVREAYFPKKSDVGTTA